MKKFFTAAVIGILFCSCGYKELSREEKFKLLYEAEILQKKDAREELNKNGAEKSELLAYDKKIAELKEKRADLLAAIDSYQKYNVSLAA